MRHPGIEIARVVGLLGVVTIHAEAAFGARQDLAFLTSELARFSVPMFFMASGFFWKSEAIARPFAATRKLAARLLLPFVIFAVIYFVADRWSLFYPRTYFGSARSYLLFPLTGGVGHHLWFLLALYIGSAITWTAIRFAGWRRSLVLSAFAYLLGCILLHFLLIAGWHTGGVLYRNGFLFAPLFLMLGYCCRLFDWPRRVGALTAAVFFAGGAALHVTEGYLLTYPSSHDMSPATVPFALGAFLLFARISVAPATLVEWGQDVFYGYLIHLMVLQAIRHALPFEGPLAATAIILATFALSMLLARVYRLGRSGLDAMKADRRPPPIT